MNNKNTFDTYEFVTENNTQNRNIICTDSQAEQYFVVEDNDTFIVNRQVQVLDGVQVYDVTPQPFYVDSADLIPVPDNFILPVSGEGNNLYGSSYLLQAVSNENNSHQVNGSTTNPKEIKSQDDDNVDSTDKQDTCTEVMLTDDQYDMLEKKGWVLLELNDKMFILDTSGLHDITNNTDLINQLRADSENDAIKTEMHTGLTKTDIVPLKTNDHVQRPPDAVDSNEITVVQNKRSLLIKNQVSEDNIVGASNEETKLIVSPTISPPIKESLKNISDVSQHFRVGNTIKVKTKLHLKDIPDEIVLGKTVNGKKLIARVVKPTKSICKDDAISKGDANSDALQKGPVLPNQPKKTLGDKPNLFTWKLEDLIIKAIHNELKTSPEQIHSITDLMTQMLETTEFPNVTNRNIIITKGVKNVEDRIEAITSAVVTGRIMSVDNQLKFVHLPSLLHSLTSGDIDTTVDMKVTQESRASKRRKTDDHDILHFHITETKRGDVVESIAITPVTRKLPHKPIEVKKQLSRLFACSSCAKIFRTEASLNEHQENQCMETTDNDALTIDVDQATALFADGSEGMSVKINPYYIVNSGGETSYVCLHCSMKFSKLSSCTRHLKTHAVSSEISTNILGSKDVIIEGKGSECETESSTRTSPIPKIQESTYKCKMCPCTYLHPATLSKHIFSAHIKVKNKN